MLAANIDIVSAESAMTIGVREKAMLIRKAKAAIDAVIRKKIKMYRDRNS